MRRRPLWNASGILCLAVSIAFCPTPAWATEDGAATDVVQAVLVEEYAVADFGVAKKKLQGALERCIKRGCSGPAKAQVYVGLGMVASQLGQKDEAMTHFKGAFLADPAAKLPSRGLTPNIRAQWDEVAKAQAAAAGDDDDASPTKVPGWANPRAFKLATEAIEADQAGRLESCIEKNRASLALEEQARTRLHLASCLARNGKLIDALRDAQKALEAGIQKRDTAVMRVARIRVKELIERIPHVTFSAPGGVKDLEVTFDERPVPTQSLSKKFSVDPGTHTVKATGTVNGFPASFEEEVELKERELKTVQITLKPAASDIVTPGQIKCMLAAKSQEDVQRCLPQNRKSLVVRAGTDFSAYSDTTRVYVLTPAVNAAVSSPTSGWNVGGSYLLDMVTAASPDIVSQASPPFRESRHAGSLTGGYKPGIYGAQASANVSKEPDYVSMTGGLALTADLNDKLITPRIGYSYTHDRIGRSSAPLSLFEKNKIFEKSFNIHEVEAGVTFVMSANMVLLVSGTAQFERGDQSKPYRYVPMFDPNTAPLVRKGEKVETVNEFRLAVRPLEQLPTSRDRYAAGGRFMLRMGNATLRLEERLYYDTWGILASTTDGRYMMDLSRHLRVWPHLRLHAQTGASFYKLAYAAYSEPNGQLIVPLFRTSDRELSPMGTVTLGAGTRIGLSEPEAEVKYGITFTGDLMHSQYFETLYIKDRTAIYGTVAFDVEF